MKKNYKNDFVQVLDFGAGNVGSLKNMLKFIGCKPILIDSPSNADKSMPFIIPGVGNFSFVKNMFDQKGFSELILDVVDRKTPILGICVGMQLLFNASEEGNCDGLKIIDGNVKEFFANEKILNTPRLNIGWRQLLERNNDNILLSNMPKPPRFYFVHGFYAECIDKNDLLFESKHGIDFCAAIKKENVTGVQFHPEKSHIFGMQFLRNWLSSI